MIIAANTGQTERQTGKRVGFVLLFVLSLVLLYGSVALACSIACSGYGFLAAVVYLLGLGFLAGGIFFLGRLREKPIRKLRQIDARPTPTFLAGVGTAHRYRPAVNADWIYILNRII